MAILRQEEPVRLPADFGLGLTVTAILGGLVLLALAAVSAVPSQGPRAETRAPEAGTGYVDFPAPVGGSPIASH